MQLNQLQTVPPQRELRLCPRPQPVPPKREGSWRLHHSPPGMHGGDCQSGQQDEGDERHSSCHWSARRFFEARTGCAASSNILWQLWVCSFVRLTKSSPHALHTGDGEKTTERPSVRAVNPCRRARSVEPTRTCTAMTAASRNHQSLRLLCEYHLLNPMDDFNHAQFRRTEYASTRVGHEIPQTASTSEEALALVVGPPQPDGVHPQNGPNSRHRRKDSAHHQHPHPLCDAPTPAVLCLFLSTGRILLFPDCTHERRQFFQLVGRMERHLPRLARFIVTGPHVNRARPR